MFATHCFSASTKFRYTYWNETVKQWNCVGLNHGERHAIDKKKVGGIIMQTGTCHAGTGFLMF